MKRSKLLVILAVCMLLSLSSLVACSGNHFHAYGNWEIAAESAEAETVTAIRSCECGVSESRELPAFTDAEFWASESAQNDHFQAGYKIFTCVYGQIRFDYAIIETQFGDWFIAQNPDLENTGVYKRECACCDLEETETIPALSDTICWTITEEVQNSHLAAGHITYSSEYGQVVIDLPQIMEHNYDGTYVIIAGNEPTLTETGLAKGKCECGEEDEIVVPALQDESCWNCIYYVVPNAEKETDGKAIYESVFGRIEIRIPWQA